MVPETGFTVGWSFKNESMLSISLEDTTEMLTFKVDVLIESMRVLQSHMSCPSPTLQSAKFLTAAPMPSAGPFPWADSKKFQVMYEKRYFLSGRILVNRKLSLFLY